MDENNFNYLPFNSKDSTFTNFTNPILNKYVLTEVQSKGTDVNNDLVKLKKSKGETYLRIDAYFQPRKLVRREPGKKYDIIYMNLNKDLKVNSKKSSKDDNKKVDFLKNFLLDNNLCAEDFRSLGYSIPDIDLNEDTEAKPKNSLEDTKAKSKNSLEDINDQFETFLGSLFTNSVISVEELQGKKYYRITKIVPKDKEKEIKEVLQHFFNKFNKKYKNIVLNYSIEFTEDNSVVEELFPYYSVIPKKQYLKSYINNFNQLEDKISKSNIVKDISLNMKLFAESQEKYEKIFNQYFLNYSGEITGKMVEELAFKNIKKVDLIETKELSQQKLLNSVNYYKVSTYFKNAEEEEEYFRTKYSHIITKINDNFRLNDNIINNVKLLKETFSEKESASKVNEGKKVREIKIEIPVIDLCNNTRVLYLLNNLGYLINSLLYHDWKIVNIKFKSRIIKSNKHGTPNIEYYLSLKVDSYLPSKLDDFIKKYQRIPEPIKNRFLMLDLDRMKVEYIKQ